MQVSRTPKPRRSHLFATAVLGISAVVIVLASLFAVHLFQSIVGNRSSVSLGVEAVGQVLGATAPHGPAASQLPGLIGTPTSTATLGPTPTPLPSLTPTDTAVPSPTQTPDVSFYDAARIRTLLAQAQTSYGVASPAFVANVGRAAGRLNNQRIAPGATFSFDTTAGPYETLTGYEPITSSTESAMTGTIPVIDGGITQVSTTLFQAVFWSGLKIVERHTHPYWLDRLGAGPSSQKGLDAYVDGQSQDFRFKNNTGDWLRIETDAQNGSIAVAIYGVDPGWNVSPNVSQPSSSQPAPTDSVLREDASLPPGARFTFSPGAPGFDVLVQRTVTLQNKTVDQYQATESYQPRKAIVLVGPQPTPTITPQASPTPVPIVNTPTAAPVVPSVSSGRIDPSLYDLPNGEVRIPSFIGMSENDAQQAIGDIGLSTTYVNAQGPGDVSAGVLDAVAVGQVLSQTPAPGTVVPRGTKVFLAVRKE